MLPRTRRAATVTSTPARRWPVLPCATALTTLALLTGCAQQDPGAAPNPVADVVSASPDTAADNGIDQRSPSAALRTALTSAASAGSFRVTGEDVGGVRLDLRFDLGTGAVGEVTGSSEVDLISTGTRVYVSGDDFLTEEVGDEVQGTVADKWLLLPENSTTGYQLFADGEGFAESLLGQADPTEMTGVREVDGVPAVGLVFAEQGSTLWVAARGPVLPIRLEQAGAVGASGVLRFTEFGEDVVIEGPPADDVIDVADVVDDAERAEDLDIEAELDAEFGEPTGR